jgi:hypothetical protein
MFVSILSSYLVVPSSCISNFSVRTGCAASSSETYSVGGISDGHVVAKMVTFIWQKFVCELQLHGGRQHCSACCP